MGKQKNEDTLLTIDSLTLCSTKPYTRALLSSFAAGLLFASLPALAQQDSFRYPFEIASATSTEANVIGDAALPDSPGALMESGRESSSSTSANEAYGFGAPTSATLPMASHTDKYISPGQQVPMLSAKDKFALGVKDAVSPLSAVGWVISAGYEQATNGSPNYGTNAKAFAQRFGASAARATSEGIFSDSIMDGVLHEDPRYYRMGPGHNFLVRIVYAGTRTIVTRTDGGHSSPNFALLAGNLGGSYLTKAYYPALNTSNTEVLKTFGGSIGGSALGFLVSEFLPNGLNVFHNSKKTSN